TGGNQASDRVDPTRTLTPESKTVVAASGRARQTLAAASAAVPAPSPAPTPAPAARRDGPVPATPSTRRLARELGVALYAVNGSGPAGRVTDDDVRAAAAGPLAALARAAGPAHPAAAAPGESPAAGGGAGRRVPKPFTRPAAEPPLPKFEHYGPIERQPLSHLRRTIAERMTLSATVIPHVTHFDRADITSLDALIQ